MPPSTQGISSLEVEDRAACSRRSASPLVKGWSSSTAIWVPPYGRRLQCRAAYFRAAYGLGPETGPSRVPDRAGRRRGEGGPRSSDRGHRLGGDARGRRGLRSQTPFRSTPTPLAAGPGGHGGMQALGEDDKAGIKRDDRRGGAPRAGIAFAPATAAAWGRRRPVQGPRRADPARPRRVRVEFELLIGEGECSGPVRVSQTDWGIKPYSALFGALKVADEVEVRLQAARRGPLVAIHGLGIEPAPRPRGVGRPCRGRRGRVLDRLDLRGVIAVASPTPRRPR